ncbi:MAG: hypothetical protein ACJ76Y_13025 [Thermoanaerobaculia bacterium]
MTTSHTPTSQPSWRRAASAFLACAALVLGMAVPHDMAAEQAGSVKVEVAETAVHPHSPAHFEDAEFKLHPPCVACLLQAQAGTVLCPPPSAQKPLARKAGTPAVASLLASGEIPLTGPARAPPSLSSISS